MTESTPYGLSEANLQKMQSRHQSTLNSIKDLQNMERSMYSKLDTSTANRTLTKDEQDKIVQEINKLSTLRTNLFANLKDVYVFAQGNVSETRNDFSKYVNAAVDIP